MKAIVDDFSCKQLELCTNSLMEGDQPWTFVVATYFMQRYGNLIASVFWDVHSFVEFNNFIKTFPKKKGEPGTGVGTPLRYLFVCAEL